MGGRFDFGDIYEQYHRDVYHFALYFTNNRQEAEDITQETFIKAMHKYDSLKEPEKLKPWILSIAKFTAIDLKRRQKFITLFPDWLSDKADEDGKTVEEQVMDKGNWQELQAALLKLKPHYRSVIILRGLKELTVQETAFALGCGERKVRVDYHRALNQLKKHVKSVNEGWDLTDGQL
ncbi:RNA polymerase sigma factor [Mesobacillus selenatarsenatis]|jgi:RNA polymerase sigma-70 factor, ECF subfamily|uniref:RNA polymerase sigma factor n=1 Tax=Mesobacillus selenatarsenatis (strain DSM 18680 / JCM 14380 / FERM P-15431 / SF-1) TaxID=1321606 RepID=A0A0A8X040_MESS1|nr:RNA polymerase sigma factor [Mesobacillus selenatarsenatis]GAM12362.1 RNA polymerase sigma factor SigW [Mesobacillus selenatarsenatis SF-1]